MFFLIMWWFYEKGLEIFRSVERKKIEIQNVFSKIWRFHEKNLGTVPPIECSRAKKFEIQYVFLKDLMIFWVKCGNFSFNWAKLFWDLVCFFSRIWWFDENKLGNFPLNWVFTNGASKKNLRFTRFFSKIWRFYQKNLEIFPLIEWLQANWFRDLVCFL